MESLIQKLFKKEKKDPLAGHSYTFSTDNLRIRSTMAGVVITDIKRKESISIPFGGKKFGQWLSKSKDKIKKMSARDIEDVIKNLGLEYFWV